jgi:hypothetical protein
MLMCNCKNRITLYKRNAGESDKIKRTAHKQKYRQTENEVLLIPYYPYT